MAAGETITVACKLPHGLELRVFNMESINEPVMGGGYRETQKAKQHGASVRIAGVSTPQGITPSSPMSGGYALTHNVDAEFWARWLNDNKDSDMVKNGLVFAVIKAGGTEAEARNREAVRSGQERLDPNRLPKGIETAPESAKAA